MARKYYKEDDEAIPAIAYVDAAPEGYTLVEDADELLALTKGTYKQRRFDGLEYVNDCLSIWRTKIMDETYTETEVSDLEIHLFAVLNEVQCGAWKTACNVCDGLATSGIFDATMKAALIAELDTYIAANY